MYCIYIRHRIFCNGLFSQKSCMKTSDMAMNLDYSYIGPYLQDWLKYVRESNDAEQQVIAGGREFRIPYTGVQMEMIRAIFIISGRFVIEPHAKYMAIHLLDRYMGCLFWELITASGGTELTEQTRQQVREKMSSQMKLILASCLLIASKVDLYKTGLGISQIQDLLQSIDPERDYSKSSVTACELRILKSLNFHLPVCLPIDAVELFLAYSELASTPLVRDTCLHILDVAYLRHEEVFAQLHLMARGRGYDKSRSECRDFLDLEANAAFLGAAVVVCSNFFFHLKKRLTESLGAKLAALIRMSAIDVNIMANILFTFAIDEEDFKRLLSTLKSRSADAVVNKQAD